MDIGAVLQRLADRKIEQAMQEGKFNNLPGAGKPVEIEPAPAEENARLRWWALKILKQNDITPDEVVWRKQLEQFKEQLATTTSEARVRSLVPAINELVRRINTLGTNAIDRPAAGVVLEEELAGLQGRVTALQVVSRIAAEQQIGQANSDSALPAGQASAAICQRSSCTHRNAPTARYCARCGSPMA